MATQWHFDIRDMEFALFEHLDLLSLAEKKPNFDLDEAGLRAVLNGALDISRNVLAPLQSVGDEQGCRLIEGQVHVPDAFIEAYREFAKGGWIATPRAVEFGGMGLPLPVAAAIMEMQVGAASSFMFYPGLAVAAGRIIETCAPEELKRLVCERLYNGTWAATMCLTEPHAGSSVGDLVTSASPLEGNEYSICGHKIFISAGDHQLTENIVHLVLARIEGDPQGTKGLSLFVVPKKRFDAAGKLTGDNDVVTTGIEKKMGIHASSTCALSFGSEGECRGYLIGERGKGIRNMFLMINEARIACGLQANANASAAYQTALAYAKERVQGTRTGDRQADAPRVPIIEHPDVRRNLLMCKAFCEGARALALQATFHMEHALIEPDPSERERHQDLADLLTPLVKAYGSDKGFRVTEWAMQVMGGYGYLRDYGVEQRMRDVKITSIYEGTNGVQALDLVGRKLRKNGGALLMRWLQETSAFVEIHKAHPSLGSTALAVERGKDEVMNVAMELASQGSDDLQLALLGATPFLELLGHVVVGRLLLEQAVVADQKLQDLDNQQPKPQSSEANFYDGKVKTAQFFAAQVLPQAQALGQSIRSKDRSALEIGF